MDKSNELKPDANKIYRECIALVSKINGATECVNINQKDAGVWNNIVLEVITGDKLYFFKKYRKLTKITNYLPPNISSKWRAKVAIFAQSEASRSFIDEYKLVPKILVKNNTSFVMEGIPNERPLLYFLSKGQCPESVTTVFPRALARFHNNTLGRKHFPDIFLDLTFRDYKLNLQYNNMSTLLSVEHGQILVDFVNEYKQRLLCMVHGDLNSKNVLIGDGDRVYVIDFEQSHIGSPSYDLAFILSEIFIASIQYKNSPSLKDACRLFTENYFNVFQEDALTYAKEATMHLATQIIYRFYGPSHLVWTSYVNSDQRTEILKFAESLVSCNPKPINVLF